MENFKKIFQNHKLSHKTSIDIYEQLKPIFKNHIRDIIYQRKTKNRGPKISVDLDQYLDAIFEYIDSGGKRFYLFKHYNISETSFNRYINLIANHRIFQTLFEQFQEQFPVNGDLIADSTTCPSKAGKDSTGWSYKIKGKRTVKIGLLVSTSKKIISLAVTPGNVDDRCNFDKIVSSRKATGPISTPIGVFVDSGYTGKDFAEKCLKNNYQIIAVPKRLRDQSYSHTVQTVDKRPLSRKRPIVEHVNSHLKRFRGIATKYVSKIKIYQSFNYLVCLIISIHNGIIRPNSIPKLLLKLKPKLFSNYFKN